MQLPAMLTDLIGVQTPHLLEGKKVHLEVF